jgi:hypothetical protein
MASFLKAEVGGSFAVLAPLAASFVQQKIDIERIKNSISHFQHYIVKQLAASRDEMKYPI